MANLQFKKEYETLRRKHSIPIGENLEAMLSTEEGRKRHKDRKKKWDAFYEKWNVLFMIGHRPVFKKKKKKASND